jgi:hypothetical protein
MDYKSVDVGKDMFLNDVVVGQKVLYLRAAPGGIGIGEVTKIEVIDKRSGNIHIGWKYGYKHFKSQRMDVWYRYTIKTQGGRITTKYFDEVIGRFDTEVYNQIKDE